ncbi:uncharacterized protein LOC127871911 isoform X2 [Dreissena polymorpha]|uniref:Galaxin-like repeats domain-containing protein n=1 Tax=Dreissena polymorpha TaxID=45954 RepID=A0A9D4RAR4_DREPO|nr:uncharacterized protein LOC127871911 isoform X2 [Dreissena polymorpha]KAH3859485.1 hypothetical protein DPMN_102302 [Dreissena polymorpha]
MYTLFKSGLTAGNKRLYIIIFLIGLLSYGDSLTCFVNDKPHRYNPENQLCCNGIYPREQNGQTMECCNGTMYAIRLQNCCAGIVYKQGSRYLCRGNKRKAPKSHKHDDTIIEKIVHVIKKDILETASVKLPNRKGPPICPSCITGIHSGPAESKRRNKLNIHLGKIEKRPRGRLRLHVTVTRPKRYAGRKMTLKTRSVCRECFKSGVDYVILTNQWLHSLPEKSRLTGMDVIVQKYQFSLFSCTIDRWTKTL